MSRDRLLPIAGRVRHGARGLPQPSPPPHPAGARSPGQTAHGGLGRPLTRRAGCGEAGTCSLSGRPPPARAAGDPCSCQPAPAPSPRPPSWGFPAPRASDDLGRRPPEPFRHTHTPTPPPPPASPCFPLSPASLPPSPLSSHSSPPPPRPPPRRPAPRAVQQGFLMSQREPGSLRPPRASAPVTHRDSRAPGPPQPPSEPHSPPPRPGARGPCPAPRASSPQCSRPLSPGPTPS